MDLGLEGKKALVCGASKGLGRGCAEALAREGVDLIINSRSMDVLETVEEELRAAHGVSVDCVAADVSQVDGQDRVIAAAQGVDILVTNAGGPPPGVWRDWEREDFIKALDANMLAPIALMKALMPTMIDKGWGRVVNITSMAVKAPIPHLGLSNAARAGLTGYVAGTSRQVAQHGVTINNLLPGIHDTERGTTQDRKRVAEQGISMEQARRERMDTIPARAYGTPEQFGAACAFLCSTHAAFIVGQNIVLDGGASNITL